MPAYRLRPLGCLLTVAAVVLPAAATAQPLNADPSTYATGRILAVPRAGLPEARLGLALRPDGARARRVGRSDLFVVDVPPGRERVMVEALRRHPHFKSAELDHRMPPSFAPNDPYAGAGWHLATIGAPAAWDLSQGYGVTIAILDTGVDATHPDLAARMVPGWNFYDGTANTADVYGHGTSVAGAAAAATDNATGVASVAGQARIMPLRISDAAGNGYWSLVAQALVHAADRGVRVANISYMVTGSSTVQNAAQYMKNKGGLVFAAAGNTGTALSTPATTTLISVSATDGADQRASWSSHGSFVALSAPGAGIYTTHRGGSYGPSSGTSLASPVAAGVAALVFAARPALTSAQAENLLFSTAADLGTAGRDPHFGHGRVDAGAAVRAAMALNSQAVDHTAPTVGIVSPAPSATAAGLLNVDVAAADDVGVVRVDLRVNGALVASDSLQPFGFTWDSSTVPNGSATLVVQAFDAAGNAAASAPVVVNVANAVAAADTTAPQVRFIAPTGGAVSGTVTVSTGAADDAGTAGIAQTLYIDGRRVAVGKGAHLYYSWNTRKIARGQHTLEVVATDAAGNTGRSSVTVSR